MALPRNLFAPSFQRQQLSILFMAIVGFMVFAATFAVVADSTLSALSLSWNKELQSRMTIEIPFVGDETSVPQTERVRQVLAVLRAIPGVAEAKVVSDEETVGLLKPWIDDASLIKSLPLPSLIDIEQKENTHLVAEDVRTRLKTVIADAHVDDHATWLADLTHLVKGLVALMGLMAFLASLTLAITVNLFCRAVMAGENETIALLHSMGAEDDDIAKHFQWLALRLSCPTSCLGFIVAGFGSVLLILLLRRFADISALEIGHWILLILAAAAVPIIAVVIAILSARFSVARFLRTMP